MADLPQHLLVVDDDADVRSLLQRYFTREGYRISVAGDGIGMRAALAAEPVDLVLLDLGLPREDGLSLMRELRATWQGAVIIITGRGEPVDRVIGLEVGADDYVAKPFDLRELLARVRSVLRRTTAAPAVAPADEAPLRFAGLRLDPLARVLTGPDGLPIELTAGEYELLLAFLLRPNQVLSRDELMGRLHGREAGPFDRAIDMQVGRLRRKIEADPANPQLLKAVRGAGYVLAARVEREAP